MRVLVTGHLGYIGSVLVPLLQQASCEVVGCDVDFFAACDFGEPPAPILNLNKDVRDLGIDELRGFSAIIHLAALSNDPLGDIDPALTHEINEVASIRLAINAKAAGVAKFLFASSCSNYGASSGELLDETAPFNPQTPYGTSKSNAESKIRTLSDDAFCAVSLRAGTVYGVAPRIRFDLVLNNLVAHALASGQVLLKSDGAAYRPLVHVEDVAKAYRAILLHSPEQDIAGEALNVGRTSENYTVSEIAQRVANALPNAELRFVDDPITDTRNYRVSCDKLADRVPTYVPTWTVDAGITQLSSALTAQVLEVDDFEGPRYSRVAHLLFRMRRNEVSSGLRLAPLNAQQDDLAANIERG